MNFLNRYLLYLILYCSLNSLNFIIYGRKLLEQIIIDLTEDVVKVHCVETEIQEILEVARQKKKLLVSTKFFTIPLN